VPFVIGGAQVQNGVQNIVVNNGDVLQLQIPIRVAVPVTVNTATVTASASPSTICEGSSSMLMGSGALS
jgi:hypothetical protein